MITLVIPAYNEAPNVPRLLDALRPFAHASRARVILVDDGSRDGTAELARELAADLELEVVSHEVNRGLGAAVDTGLRYALRNAADDDAIVTMEADTTSDVGDLPVMLARFDAGYDVVLASVYAPGGRIVGVAGWRVAASRAVSDVFRVAGGMRDVHTLSSLYRVYRAGALRRAAAAYGTRLVRESGFAVNIELLLKLRSCGARVCEVPTVNDWTTRLGASKMRVRPTLQAYGRLLIAHTAERVQPAPVSPQPLPQLGGADAVAARPLEVVA